MPYLSFAAICLLFGSNFFLMSLASDAFGPVGVGAWRVVGAAVVLVLAWRLFASGQSIPRNAWWRIVALGLVANGYPYVVQPWLIARFDDHSYFAMMVAFAPLLTILVSVPMLGVWPSRRQLLGVLLGLVFMGLLLLDGDARGIPLGMLLLAISVPLSYAIANTYLRLHLREVPSTALTAAMLGAPMAVLLPLSQMHGTLTGLGIGPPAEPTNLPTAVMALLILGALGTGATMWLFVRLVQQQGPLFAGMVTYVVPLIALMWGVFDEQTITPRQLIAMGGVLASVALVQYGAAKPPAVKTTEAPEVDAADGDSGVSADVTPVTAEV